ncbi:MAG: M28 family peptidase [Flavobacteriales bacterium]|nr:M28 family peptidase [Flavobacteriales bacterium]MCB9178757.1 M28 family peptidase [Flavobacteriales bacterium]HPF89084.1 M28 family peptidase [Flavobacteriales bacterium]
MRLRLLSWSMLLCICQQPTVDVCAQSARERAFDAAASVSEQGYEWLAWSTTHIGHRLTGSDQGHRAELLADSLFRASDLDTVFFEPFEAQAWSRGTVSLTVGDTKGYQHLACVALANTPLSCTTEAPIVDAGNGLQEDLDRLGPASKGAALLINLGLVAAAEGTPNLHRSEKAALAMKHGASAILFVNQVVGGVVLTGTASIDGSLIPIPAACLSTEDGTHLRERLGRGEVLTARLNMHNRSEWVTARNIIGELHGTEHPEEIILIGGHLDSWDLATGATDNGLGSFSILDLARLMASMPFRPQRTVRFVLFMGEEQGLLGSTALAERYTENGTLERIACMINLDMSGNPQGFGVSGPAGWHTVMQGACDRIHRIDTAAFEGRTSEEVWLHSDHEPFLLRGVPVIYPLSDLGSHVYGCYHSTCDDIHLVEPSAMTNNVRFVGALVYELAAASRLPGHFSPEELKARLISEGLETSLRIAGVWPWE